MKNVQKTFRRMAPDEQMPADVRQQMIDMLGDLAELIRDDKIKSVAIIADHGGEITASLAGMGELFSLLGGLRVAEHDILQAMEPQREENKSARAALRDIIDRETQGMPN